MGMGDKKITQMVMTVLTKSKSSTKMQIMFGFLLSKVISNLGKVSINILAVTLFYDSYSFHSSGKI